MWFVCSYSERRERSYIVSHDHVGRLWSLSYNSLKMVSNPPLQCHVQAHNMFPLILFLASILSKLDYYLKNSVWMRVPIEDDCTTINCTWYRSYMSYQKIHNRPSIEENKALRYTVNARKAIVISASRGEIGTSLQTSRDMRSKIFYIKPIRLHNNLLKEILLHQFEEKQPSKWIKQIKTVCKILTSTFMQ